MLKLDSVEIRKSILKALHVQLSFSTLISAGNLLWVFLGRHKDILPGHKSEAGQALLLNVLLKDQGDCSAQLIIEEPQGIILEENINISQVFALRLVQTFLM